MRFKSHLPFPAVSESDIITGYFMKTHPGLGGTGEYKHEVWRLVKNSLQSTRYQSDFEPLFLIGRPKVISTILWEDDIWD